MRLDLNDYQWLTEEVGMIQGRTILFDIYAADLTLQHDVLAVLNRAKRVLVEFRFLTGIALSMLETVLNQIFDNVDSECDLVLATHSSSDLEDGLLLLTFLAHLDEVDSKRLPENIRKADELAFDAENNILIWPLTSKHLEKAIALRDSVFGDLSEDEYLSLEASLDRDGYAQWYRNMNILDLSYWVAVDENAQRVIGLVGFYNEECNPEETKTWLGWFCVDPEYRGIGLGKRLLEYAIEQTERERLYLYTTSEPSYAAARKLYEKREFVNYKTIDEVMYYSLNLKGE